MLVSPKVATREHTKEPQIPTLQSAERSIADRFENTFHLKVDESRKSGVLVTPRKSVKVTIMKLNVRGDALVHDGTRIMMVPSKHVAIGTSEETEGAKRLELVKRTYEAISTGAVIDVAAVYAEVRSWLV